MKYSYTAKKRIRKSFGKLGDVLPIPNLIELQVLSYNKFLGKNSRGQIDFSNSGLDEVFKSVFPIYDYANNCKLEYTGFKLGREEYTEEECRITGKSYSVPLKVDLKLSINLGQFKNLIFFKYLYRFIFSLDLIFDSKFLKFISQPIILLFF